MLLPIYKVTGCCFPWVASLPSPHHQTHSGKPANTLTCPPGWQRPLRPPSLGRVWANYISTLILNSCFASKFLTSRFKNQCQKDSDDSIVAKSQRQLYVNNDFWSNIFENVLFQCSIIYLCTDEHQFVENPKTWSHSDIQKQKKFSLEDDQWWPPYGFRVSWYDLIIQKSAWLEKSTRRSLL